MKVLLSERTFKGHRKTYMEWLSHVPGVEFFIIAPENFGIDDKHFRKYESTGGIKTVKEYLAWINQMKDIVEQNKIDIVHILDGDSIMRWFGFGLSFSKARKTVITYHHFFPGAVRRWSYRLMCHGKKRMCVAHTVSVEHSLKECGIKQVFRCEYPAFSFDSIASRNPAKCKEKYGIPSDVPTIGIVGGLSIYKNIIPFLETMQNCCQDFHILICGKDSGVGKEKIQTAVKPYADRVTMKIEHLSDDEYEEAIVASDIIFCIYGREFDGASGPLTDGVCAGKLILACKHGSLGEIVSQNLLGITAECDDSKDMLCKTELALSRIVEFKYGEMANKYRMHLNPELFQERYKNIYEVE
ncbi:MAG: hypothetical protein Q4C77_15185 [Eubacteriales bacterium]|nr:hypothetical protein [Eubacteriales bacterium]